MTREELQHCDAELRPLVPTDWACALAREHARSYNQNVDGVRAALLEPARDLLERGAALSELPACLEKTVAELAFWRRVLLKVHGAALGPDSPRPDYLLRYLTS